MDEETKRKMRGVYHRRESMNQHTANARMLINEFGTEEDKRESEEMFKTFKKQGYSSPEMSDFFYRKGHVHYSKLW